MPTVSPRTGRGGRALRIAGAVGLIAVGAVGVLGATQGSAGAAGSYQAGAAANGLRMTMTSDAFPVDHSPIDVTAPMAQVSSSTVEQKAFSSYPYPGSLAAAIPGLVGGLAADQGYPLPFAVPGYPITANARCSGDTQTTKVPDTEGAGVPGSLPYTMTSGCTPNSAEARATSGSSSVQGGVGLTVGYVAAVARSAQDAAGVTTAVGTSEASGINVGGGLLQMSGINALASATVNPSGTFSPDSSFGIGTISVAGTPVSFGPKGFSRADGSSTPVDISAINSILRNAGIEVIYITESRTKDSITSAGVQITMTQKDPQSGLPVVTRYVFGQVTANASAQTFDAAPSGTVPSGTVPSGTVPSGTAAAAPGGVAGPAVDAAGLPSTVGAVPPATSLQPTVGIVPGEAAELVRATGVSGSVLSFYLVLVLAGAALLGSSGLAAFLKGALPWTR